MNNTNITIGTKFASKQLPNFIRTIVNVTEKRVVYNDGKKHSCGSTNRKQINSWLTIKGFLERIESGEYFIV